MSEYTFDGLYQDAERELDFARTAKTENIEEGAAWALRRAFELFCAAAAKAPEVTTRAKILSRASGIALEMGDTDLARTLADSGRRSV